MKSRKSKYIRHKGKKATPKKHNEDNLFNVSESITNNVKSMKNILKKEPNYLSQFQVQTFDTYGEPCCANDVHCVKDKSKLIDLERKLALDGGWSQCNDPMSYGVMPNDELVHNNMNPCYSIKHGYGSNDLHNETVMNYKNELFTGNLQNSWNKKREIQPHFSPCVNKTNIYGTQVRTDEEQSRYIPGRYRQNEKPFESIKVTPGLGLGAHDVGTHGLHSTYVCPYKTIDELHVKPKITYEGRVIPGMKGQERPVQAKVTSYRPPSFKTTTQEDLLPLYGEIDGPKTRENFIMRDTDRSHQHFEYTGGAYNSADALEKNIPEYMRELHKISNKPVFTLPNPLHKFAKNELCHNPNLESYNLPFTNKDQIIENEKIGSMSVPESKIYANLTAPLNTTGRETLENINHSYVKPNTMRGIVQNVNIADTTTKETTIVNQLNPYISSFDNIHRVYNNDSAKITAKELMNQPVETINPTVATNIYANYTSIPDATVKDINIDATIYQPVISSVIQQSKTFNPNEILNNTMQETTINSPFMNHIKPINQQYTLHLNDLPKNTIRETTVENNNLNFLTPVDHGQYVPTMNAPNNTMRETMIGIPTNNFLNPINKQSQAFNSNDSTNTTIRETMTSIPKNNFIVPLNYNQPTVHYGQPVDITSKETNLHTSIFRMPHENQKMKTNLMDGPKNTLRETICIPYNNFISPVDQQQKFGHSLNPTDVTMRETIVSTPRNNFINPINHNPKASDISNSTATTIKDLYVDNNNVFLVDPREQKTTAFNRNRVLDNTMRETNLIHVPYHNVTPVNQQQNRNNMHDIPNVTMRETTLGAVNNNITAPNGQIKSYLSEPVKTTAKETMLMTKLGHVTGENNYRVYDNNPAKPTIKESTIMIPYNTNISSIKHGKNSTFKNDLLKPTIKEQMIENPNNIIIGGVHNQPKTQLQDIPKSTIRETINVPYNTHIDTTIRHGKNSAFNYENLDAIVKETYIDNNHVGIVNNVINNGYGYLSENVNAPNTNRQFTCQEVYITPLTGNSKNRPYDDMYNAEINDTKELLHWYHEPTKCNFNLIPTMENTFVSLKNDENVSQNIVVGTSFNNELDRPKMNVQMKNNDGINVSRFVDPILLDQLKRNPFNIKRGKCQ